MKVYIVKENEKKWCPSSSESKTKQILAVQRVDQTGLKFEQPARKWHLGLVALDWLIYQTTISCQGCFITVPIYSNRVSTNQSSIVHSDENRSYLVHVIHLSTRIFIDVSGRSTSKLFSDFLLNPVKLTVVGTISLSSLLISYALRQSTGDSSCLCSVVVAYQNREEMALLSRHISRRLLNDIHVPIQVSLSPQYFERSFHTTVVACRVQAGRYQRTVNRTRPLNYEQVCAVVRSIDWLARIRIVFLFQVSPEFRSGIGISLKFRPVLVNQAINGSV